MMNKKILEKLQDDILIFDQNGVIIFCSRHLLKRLNYGELADQKLADILNTQQVGKLQKKMTSGEVQSLSFKDANGIIQPAEADIIMDEEKGQAQYWIIVRSWENGKYTKEELEQIINQLEKRELENISRGLLTGSKNIKLADTIKEQLKARKEEEEHVRGLFDSTIALYIMYNLKTGQCNVNKGWKELSGWSDEDMTPFDDSKIVYEEDKEEFYKRMHDAIEKKQPVKTVSRFYCKNSSEYKWIKWKARLSEDGESIIMFGSDITQEVNNLEQKKAYKKALELETSKTEFLANMSHELKTPLNILYGILQLEELKIKEIVTNNIREVDLNEFICHKNIMKQNIFRLLRLTNNIIDISRIGAGSYKPKMQNCNIVEVVEDITMSVAEYVKGKKMSIIFDTQEEEIETACDVEKMERIMLNLLSNAVKYSKKEGHIQVNISQKDKNIVIDVTDDGIGIPENQLKNIFERFVQVDSTFTRRSEGSGIGLSLVKGLVEMMHGTISVQSTLGKGTTFTVTIPVMHVKEKEGKGNTKDSTASSRIEKCYVEFSDVYNLNESRERLRKDHKPEQENRVRLAL